MFICRNSAKIDSPHNTSSGLTAAYDHLIIKTFFYAKIRKGPIYIFFQVKLKTLEVKVVEVKSVVNVFCGEWQLSNCKRTISN